MEPWRTAICVTAHAGEEYAREYPIRIDVPATCEGPASVAAEGQAR